MDGVAGPIPCSRTLREHQKGRPFDARNRLSPGHP